MKITICDICFYKETKETRATYRIGYRNGMKVDACNEHKNSTKGKTELEFGSWLFDKEKS